MDEDPNRPSEGAAGLRSRRSPQVDARRLILLDTAAAALVARSRQPDRVDEPASSRDLAQPRWICFHIVSWSFAVLAVRLGWWQLTVSDRKGFDIQNFGYWLHWWAFAAFAVFFWARAVFLVRRPPADRRSEGIVIGHSNGAIVRLGNTGATIAPTGAVELVSPDSSPDDPLVYRGYKMPSTSDAPVRSHGDSLHNAYNDYLWEIALADGDTPDRRSS